MHERSCSTVYSNSPEWDNIQRFSSNHPPKSEKANVVQDSLKPSRAESLLLPAIVDNETVVEDI